MATATKAFTGYSVGNFPRRHPEERQPRLKETAPAGLMPESDERISGAPGSESLIDEGQFRRSISGNVSEANTETRH
jgi:hypothetical protein